MNFPDWLWKLHKRSIKFASSDIMQFIKHRIIDLHKDTRNQEYIDSYLKCSQPSVRREIKQYFNDGHFENNLLNSGPKILREMVESYRMLLKNRF